MENKVFQVGPIRPPSESNSLLLRVTENCSWNKCKFCLLYKEHPFRVRQIEDIKKDIDVMAGYRDRIFPYLENGKLDNQEINKDFNSLATYEEKACYQMVFTWMTEGNKRAMFLQDANTIVIRPSWLVEILEYIKVKLPELSRITSYGRADALSRIPSEDFKKIAKAGLNRIHSGYESGSDKVLELIDKGVTKEEEIIGGKKVKAAGIELSIYFMPGIGGREFSSENAMETANVINEVNPDFVRLRTFVLKSGSPMEELKKKGEFTECSDIEKILEIRKMLESIDTEKVNGKITSDHIINLLPNIHGYMGEGNVKFIKRIDDFLNLPRTEQKKYQIIRRQGSPIDFTHMSRIPTEELEEIERLANSIPDGEEWEDLMKHYLSIYI